MSSQLIPFEFRGLARMFRQRVETAELAYNDLVTKLIINPLHARVSRKPTLRKGTAIDIERGLQSIKTPYRLSSSVEVVNKTHLRIVDILIAGMHDKDPTWDEWEKTIGIIRATITTEGGVHIDTKPLVSISGHAIARWYERSRSRDESKLVRDLIMILDSKDPDCAAASNGVWLGPSIRAHAIVNEDVKLLEVRTVRTYLCGDQINMNTWSPTRTAVAA